jgi:hypothetical protein
VTGSLQPLQICVVKENALQTRKLVTMLMQTHLHCSLKMATLNTNRLTHMQACTLESGRSAALAIDRVKTALEYGQVPSVQVEPLVRMLLGLLHVRCAA